MMQEVVVNYQQRRGLGPRWNHKIYVTAFDDLPPETENWEIYDMARREFIESMHRSEDFPLYGENWIIGEIELI